MLLSPCYNYMSLYIMLHTCLFALTGEEHCIHRGLCCHSDYYTHMVSYSHAVSLIAKHLLLLIRDQFSVILKLILVTHWSQSGDIMG